MSRKNGKAFPIGDARHETGPLAGEPMQAAREPRLPVDKAETIWRPRIALARAQAMGWPVSEEVRKFVALQESNEVPGPGTPPPKRAKGSVLPEVAASRQIPNTHERWREVVGDGQVVDPPFDPWLLTSAVAESHILPPSIDAYATNIGGFGLELEPTYPTQDEDGAKLEPPKDAEAQKSTAALFFAGCNVRLGVQGLMYQVDHDVEEIGYGFIEVLRNRLGTPAALEHVPAYTMRLGRLSEPILVDRQVRHPITNALVVVPRYERFRTFLQIRDDRAIYFKEFGDPRTINRETGAFKAEGSWGVDVSGNNLDGTEVRYFRQYASWTPYGVPRWLGALPQARISRFIGEMMADYFANAPIGTKGIFVAGGVWAKTTLDRAMDQIDEAARGMENAWSFVALEAGADQTRDPLEPSSEARPAIVVEDLAAHPPETLYAGDTSLWTQSAGHVEGMFRLPPIYYGRADDYTRATSAVSRGATEEQVFVPIRSMRWYPFLNQEILAELGINLWKVCLQGANTTDDAEFPIAELDTAGGLSPNAAIRAWNEYTGENRDLITEAWGERPMALTLKLLDLKVDPNLPLADIAGKLEEIATQEREDAAAALDATLKAKTGAGAAPGGGPGVKPGVKPAPRQATKGEVEAADALGRLEEVVALRDGVIRLLRKPAE